MVREVGLRLWASLATLFPRGRRRKLEAAARLTKAYQEVFHGRPSREDQQLVLADLAAESGFYRVSPAATYSSEQLWQQEGSRLLYGRIFEHLALEEADLRALEVAARREAAISQDPYEGMNNAQ